MNSIWFSDYRTNKVITFTCISKSDDVLSLFVEAYIHVPYEGPDYPIEISFRTMIHVSQKSWSRLHKDLLTITEESVRTLHYSSDDGRLVITCKSIRDVYEFTFDIYDQQEDCRLHEIIQADTVNMYKVKQRLNDRLKSEPMSIVHQKYSNNTEVLFQWDYLRTESDNSYSNLLIMSSSFTVKVCPMWMFEEERRKYVEEFFPKLISGKLKDLDFFDCEGVNITFSRHKHVIYLSGRICDLHDENWDWLEFTIMIDKDEINI